MWISTAAVALAFASGAEAKPKPAAAFKVVSVSGSVSLAFEEANGGTCDGSTSSEVSWRSTKPFKVYAFLKRMGGKPSVELSADRVGEKFEVVPIDGEATVTRSVDYSNTTDCLSKPTACPGETADAKPFLTGTADSGGAVNSGIDQVSLPRVCGYSDGIAAGIVRPYGYYAARAFTGTSKAAFAVPRSKLLDPKLKRVEDSVTVEEPLSGKYSEGDDQGSFTGTYTDHLEIELKRLKP